MKNSEPAENFLHHSPHPPPPDLTAWPLSWALWYGSMGWPVFPVRGTTDTGDAQKHPLRGSRGFLDASTDRGEIRRQFDRAPDRLGVGVATGTAAGFWALDIDGEEGAQSLEALIHAHGSPPHTVTGRTGGGGWHLLFRMPSDRPLRNSASKIAPKIDTRGDGGYIVLPPSPHPSGRLYRWLPGRAPHEIEIATAPVWLLDLASPPAPLLADLPPNSPPGGSWEPHEELPSIPSSAPPRPGHVDPDSEDWPRHALAVVRKQLRTVLAAPVGSRNDTLHRAAYVLGRLAGKGLVDEATARNALATAGRLVGLTEEEIKKTLQSGLKAGRSSR
jgi:putative DNA primase/helicase